jgi:hypothetical protein
MRRFFFVRLSLFSAIHPPALHFPKELENATIKHQCYKSKNENPANRKQGRYPGQCYAPPKIPGGIIFRRAGPVLEMMRPDFAEIESI